MSWDWPGFVLVALAGAFAIAQIARACEVPGPQVRILWLSWAAHVAGAWLRYQVLWSAYGGYGDAVRYYDIGWEYAQALWQLDLSILDSDHWWSGRLWGTQFVTYVSGLVLACIGPTMVGEFLAFSFFSLFGLILVIQAVRRESEEAAGRYAPWVLLLPSLCFWPSSVGKEAVMILALGVATYGYSSGLSGRGGVYLVLGLALSLAVRPYVAAFLGAAVAMAEALRMRRDSSKTRSLLIVAVVALVVSQVAQLYGVNPFELDELTEFVGSVADMTSQGGSRIQTVEGIASVPYGLVNVLFRPFLWEASGFLGFLSALELTVLWVYIWRRRREIAGSLGRWGERPTLRIGLSLSVMLALGYGISYFNLGILARQRTLIWPFLLLLLAIDTRSAVAASEPRPEVIPEPLEREQLLL